MELNEKVYKLLGEIDQEKLKVFIIKECVKDSSFAHRFLALGNETIFPVNSSDYRDRINKLIDKYGDRYGFINYNRSFEFSQEVFDILEEADAAIAEERWNTAVAALTGIVNMSRDIIENCDDSAGCLGQVIDNCFERWVDLSLSDLPVRFRNEIFNLSLKMFKEKHLEGWDWWWKWMEIAINLADSEEKRNQVFHVLDSTETESEHDLHRRHVKEQIATYKLKLIRLAEDNDQALRFMYDNMSIPGIRKELLEYLWQLKEYDEILKIAEDGVKNDQKWERHTNEWLVWKFKVYRLTNDNEKTLALARYFFLENSFFCQNFFSQDELYSLIKSLVPTDKWTDYVEGLLLEGRNHPQYDHSLYIYEKEKMWDSYIGYLKEHPSTQIIDHAPQEVKQKYKETLIDLYAIEVSNFFQAALGRSQYKHGVDLLNKLILLGGKEKALQIKTGQIQRTPRRPALIDELSKLKI